MHKNNLLNVYRHKSSGEYLRLIKLRESNVNTFIQVDSNNNPIIKKRPWSMGSVSNQRRIIRGFDNLICEIKTLNTTSDDICD